VLRALRREPEALQAWLAEIAPARGQHAGLDRAVDIVLTSIADLRMPRLVPDGWPT
jgi:putative acyl-CoA dehydrogenase